MYESGELAETLGVEQPDGEPETQVPQPASGTTQSPPLQIET